MALRWPRVMQTPASNDYLVGIAGLGVHLRGELKEAAANFARAEALQHESEPSKQIPLQYRGVCHARAPAPHGDAAYARRVSEANTTICETQWLAG